MRTLPKRQGMPRGTLLFHDDLLGVLLADGGVNAGDDLVRRALGVLDEAAVRAVDSGHHLPAGVEGCFGAAGLLLALPELHKLGLLYQQGGQWQGKQLLDPNWVRESGSKQVENEEDGYGYLFWRGKYDSYRADGLYGQYSVILPAQEAVITCTAESRNQKQLLETLLDAIVPQL